MASIEPQIEAIGATDAEAVWPLSIEAGWNQNVADWQFMLGAGRGFGMKNAAGVWEASSLVLPLGQKLAWISMVLVTKSRRRGGVGRTLLKRCIEEVRASGAVAGLDATEQGRPIYLPLGFHDLYQIARWHLGVASETIAPPAGLIVRGVGVADVAKLAIFDNPRSGMQRPALLAHLATRQPRLAWLAETASGELAGFALGREGRVASSIGPVVADNEAAALALIAKATTLAQGPFIIDVPKAHNGIARWLQRQGAQSPRGYVRMTLGTVEGLDNPGHVFALAGPELG
jgi:GNAT superfamily N-acetyltransferase